MVAKASSPTSKAMLLLLCGSLVGSYWTEKQNLNHSPRSGCAGTHVCADFEAELVEMDGEDNHVHLLVNYPAQNIPYLLW
jgi:hypothetical protein